MTRPMSEFRQSDAWIELSLRILDSFEHYLGRPLIERSGSRDQQARDLFNSPAVVVAHGTEDDPILCYANRTAIDLWETDLDTILRLPSRKTAEPMERADRANMLKRGQEKGYIDDYQGIRITTTGKRFQIKQAIIWNLIDKAGQIVGQAATFNQWAFIAD
jgi:hypothetical protein